MAGSYGCGPDRSYLNISRSSLFVPYSSLFHTLGFISFLQQSARPPSSQLTCISIQSYSVLSPRDKTILGSPIVLVISSSARQNNRPQPFSARSHTATHPGSVHVSHYYGTAELAPSR